jgi:CheY-like chemotaxis protein
MALNEREKIHYELLEALYKARRQVEYLEAALAHNAAFLGTGVEREDMAAPSSDSGPDAMPEEVLRYLDMVGKEEDISDYVGHEGDEASRPKLGPDAPEAVRPETRPRSGKLVGQLALGHPNDALVLPDLCAAGAAPVAEAPPARPVTVAAPFARPTPPVTEVTPQAAVQDRSAPAEQNLRWQASLVEYSLDILVAEDDAVNRFAMSTLLGRAGHRVLCVEDGRKALEVLLLRPYSCLITDVHMPVMDGMELVRRIRAGDASGIIPSPVILETMGFDPDSRPPLRPLPGDLPIIALSGQSLDEGGHPYVVPGVDLFLTKPLNVQELRAVLAEVAERIRCNQEKNPERPQG